MKIIYFDFFDECKNEFMNFYRISDFMSDKMLGKYKGIL